MGHGYRKGLCSYSTQARDSKPCSHADAHKPPTTLTRVYKGPALAAIDRNTVVWTAGHRPHGGQHRPGPNSLLLVTCATAMQDSTPMSKVLHKPFTLDNPPWNFLGFELLNPPQASWFALQHSMITGTLFNLTCTRQHLQKDLQCKH